MNILHGVQNFLQFINDNWTVIAVIISLLIALGQKIESYMSKSNEEKIAIAKQQIQETMLMLVTEAEKDYLEWTKAGSVKRSQVIDKVFKMYPVLSKIVNQEEIIEWIDSVINESLKTMRDIFEQQSLENGESDAEEIVG